MLLAAVRDDVERVAAMQLDVMMDDVVEIGLLLLRLVGYLN